MLKVHFLNRYIHIFVIVFFEFFGTLLFAYANFNLINAKANARTDLERIMYFFVDFSLSMFMCISYGRQFSGALYNPAVVMFRFFRRTERYPIKIGLLYMLMQFLGGIGGSYFGTPLWIQPSILMTFGMLPLWKNSPNSHKLTTSLPRCMGRWYWLLWCKSLLKKGLLSSSITDSFISVYLCFFWLPGLTVQNQMESTLPSDLDFNSHTAPKFIVLFPLRCHIFWLQAL